MRYKGRILEVGSKWPVVATALASLIFFILTLVFQKEFSAGLWVICLLFWALGLMASLFRLFSGRYIWVKPGSQLHSEIMQELYGDAKGHGPFEYFDWGFSYLGDGERQDQSWDDVDIVVAYKVDLFTIDDLVLLIIFKDGRAFKMSESSDGWTEFCKNLIGSGLGVRADWEDQVRQPAFAQNLTLLFDRNAQGLDGVRSRFKFDS